MQNKEEHINKEILQELDELNAGILKIRESSAYKVPTPYFNDLASSIEVELSESNPYKIKDSYFNELADNIHLRVKDEPKSSAFLIKRRFILSGIAASFLLITAVWLLFPKTEVDANHSLAEAELFLEESIIDMELEDMIDLELVEQNLEAQNLIPHDEMESYIEEIIIDFNIEELTELL